MMKLNKQRLLLKSEKSYESRNNPQMNLNLFNVRLALDDLRLIESTNIFRFVRPVDLNLNDNFLNRKI